MRSRDRFDQLCGAFAVVADILAILGGFRLAFWIRFDSGWIAYKSYPPTRNYEVLGLLAVILLLLIYRSLDLYKRPQAGHFTERIPRIVRANMLGFIIALAAASFFRTDPEFSRLTIVFSFLTVTFLVLVERNILFQSERHWAKYSAEKKAVVILGTSGLAARLKESLEGEPRLRYKVVAFFGAHKDDLDPEIPTDLVKGLVSDVPNYLAENTVDEVMVANPSVWSHEQMVEIILHCEKNMADFHMVPDMFRLLTSQVEVQSVNGIPLVGVGRWPLDYFWNRSVKRLEDVVGSIVGLTLSAPIIAVAAILVKATSKGPIFYYQERCGEKGEPFHLVKLRTMKIDAEAETGPVWTTENDPRRTKVGAVLRQLNLDELPQFWNVLKGEMSLVGPRPERPHFVDQFKDDVSQYMWRHYSKPGITGLAQVNGLRGNTSIKDRIKYDLLYLEDWSVWLDFKVMARTLFSRKNAY